MCVMYHQTIDGTKFFPRLPLESHGSRRHTKVCRAGAWENHVPEGMGGTHVHFVYCSISFVAWRAYREWGGCAGE